MAYTTIGGLFQPRVKSILIDALPGQFFPVSLTLPDSMPPYQRKFNGFLAGHPDGLFFHAWLAPWDAPEPTLVEALAQHGNEHVMAILAPVEDAVILLYWTLTQRAQHWDLDSKVVISGIAEKWASGAVDPEWTPDGQFLSKSIRKEEAAVKEMLFSLDAGGNGVGARAAYMPGKFLTIKFEDRDGAAKEKVRPSQITIWYFDGALRIACNEPEGQILLASDHYMLRTPTVKGVEGELWFWDAARDFWGEFSMASLYAPDEIAGVPLTGVMGGGEWVTLQSAWAMEQAQREKISRRVRQLGQLRPRAKRAGR